MTSSNSVSPKDLKKEILTALETRLAVLGFSLRQQHFEKDTQDLVKMIHIAFINDRSKKGVAAVVNLAVRHKKIESFVNRLRREVSEADKRQSATIGTQLGKLLGKGQLRWAVATRTDAAKAADEIFKLLERYGIDYLNEFSSLESIAKKWSHPKPLSWDQSDIGRAWRLPVLLAILGRNDAAAEEFAAQHEYLREQEGSEASERYLEFARIVSEEFGLPRRIG